MNVKLDGRTLLHFSSAKRCSCRDVPRASAYNFARHGVPLSPQYGTRPLHVLAMQLRSQRHAVDAGHVGGLAERSAVIAA